MRKVLVIAAVLGAFCTAQVAAQDIAGLIAAAQAQAAAAMAMSSAPKTYDPFYVLPGTTGSIGVDAGITSPDVSSIADVSDVFVVGKYSVNDKIEVGARATFGFLREDGDAFSSALIGAKYGLTEKSAAIANVLLPIGEVEDPGVSVGYMQSMTAGTINVDCQAVASLLDGYTGGTGVGIDLLIEPSKVINDKMTGYLDVLVSTNTDDIAGDPLGINLRPYVDYTVKEGCVISAGISVGIAGDAKQDDIGIQVAAIHTMSK